MSGLKGPRSELVGLCRGRLKGFRGSAWAIAIRKIGSEQHHEEEQQPQHEEITAKPGTGCIVFRTARLARGPRRG